VFRGLSWSQAQNGKGFLLLFRDRTGRRCATPPALRAYFFLPFVVLFLLEAFELDFLAVFLVAMALVPPFYVAQSKER
jgi:hypothetical protein